MWGGGVGVKPGWLRVLQPSRWCESGVGGCYSMSLR